MTEPGLPGRIWRRARPLAATLRIGLLPGGAARVGYLGLVPRYNSHNLGDAMMMPLFARELAPVRLCHMMKFRPIEFRVWRLTCRRAFSACILGGGTLIFWQAFLDYLTIALDAGVPCYALGTGVLDPEFWGQHEPELIATRDRWVAALKACRFVGVRGEASRRILTGMGVEGVEAVGDPCLLLAGPGPVRGTLGGPPVLGINWGTSGGKVWGGDERQPMEELARAASLLAQRGWRLRLFCVWPNDRPAIRELAALLPTGSWTLAEHFLSAEDFMADAALCTAFAGMKLHATALVLCAGVPSVMLEYRPKCREFMESVGLEDLSVRVDHLDASDLAARIENLGEAWLRLYPVWQARTAELTGRLRRAIALVRSPGAGT